MEIPRLTNLGSCGYKPALQPSSRDSSKGRVSELWESQEGQEIILSLGNHHLLVGISETLTQPC